MATHTRSFRLPDDLLARLEDRAALSGDSANALAARYLREGLRMDAHPLVVFIQRPSGRRAMLAGTRLNIADVIAAAKAGGSAEAAAETFDLPLWKIHGALSYYAEFRGEIDEEIARDERLAEREEARWRAERTALA